MNFKDILSLFKLGKATAKSHIKNLIEIAAADGKFSDDEELLLESIAKRSNISKKQIEEIRKNPEHVEFEIPESEREKFKQFYDLVHMMTIDKRIHSEELRLCELYGIKFGYEKESIKEMIEAIRLNIENGSSHDETLKRIGPYYKIITGE